MIRERAVARNGIRSGRSQRGAVLLTSLLILLILSLLAISSMQSTTMQERMVLAQREGYQSMEGAELALREAEAAIDGLASPANIGSLNGFYAEGDAPRGTDVFASANWTGETKSVAVPIPKEDGQPIYAEAPRYYVEYVGDAQASVGNANNDINMSGYTHETGAVTTKAFRIVARGTGATGQSERILEEYYRREF